MIQENQNSWSVCISSDFELNFLNFGLCSKRIPFSRQCNNVYNRLGRSSERPFCCVRV